MTKCIWTSLTYCRLTKIKYLLECFIKGGQDKISTVYEVSAVVLEMMRCADVILVLLQFLTIFWSHLLPHIVCDHLDTCPVSSFIFVICPSVSCVLLPPPPEYSHVKLLSMMTTYVDMVAGNHTQWPGLTTLMTMCLQFPSCQVQTLPLLLLISVVSLPDCNWNPTIRDIFVDNLSINIIQTTVSCRKNTKMF